MAHRYTAVLSLARGCLVSAAFACAALLCASLTTADTDDSEASTVSRLENSPLTRVQAVVGSSVLLPCDVTPSIPTSSDAPILVLFYYETKGTPIYSVDARGSSLYSGERWSDIEQLEDRATLQVRSGQQGLLLTRLVVEDAGEYRCRVDFKTSPTRNIRIHLEIIVPPLHILVTSSWDEGNIVSGMVGPYPEGADVSLTCQVTGGKPVPSVTWWQAGSLMDDNSEVSTKQVTRNTLRLPRLTKADLLRKLTCIASNSNMTAPLSAAVVIDIAFPPSSVRISLKKSINLQREVAKHATSETDQVAHSVIDDDMVTLRVHREDYLMCESTGSRPRATLVWKKNGRPLPETRISSTDPIVQLRSVNLGTTTSSSFLKIVPTVDDHKAVVSCEAASPKLPKESLEDEVILNILYQPLINLSFESKISFDNLEEGDDFSFSCSVRANPTAGQLQWARNGVPILANSSNGIYISENRIVITKASRSQSGRYTCAAANTEGVTTSNTIDVKIKFAPVCSTQIQRQYGAGKMEKISITCWVESHPVPLSYRWAFNRSTEIVDFAQNSYSSSGMSSTLNYLPRTQSDFGSLLCWAANDVGLMKEPCVIQIVPAAKPESVRNCDIVSNSSMPRSVALVSCVPGWDGGLEQTFTLEVRESKYKHSRILASVQHSPTPLFNMKGLKHDEEYLFIVTSVNTRGTSSPVTLSYTVPTMVNTTISSADKSNSMAWLSWTLSVAVIIGVLITFLACSCAVICLMKFKSNMTSKTSTKILYSGSISNCQNKKVKTLDSPNIIFCDNHDCEVSESLTDHYVQTVSCERIDATAKQRTCLANEKDNEFRSSGSDIRIQTPCGWISESGSICEESYFRNSGPYHINSLSPPPLLLFPHTPCTMPKHNSSAPLASSDSLGQYSSSNSIPSSSNFTTSGFSTSTVALHPHYVPGDGPRDASSCTTPLMQSSSKESAV